MGVENVMNVVLSELQWANCVSIVIFVAMVIGFIAMAVEMKKMKDALERIEVRAECIHQNQYLDKEDLIGD